MRQWRIGTEFVLRHAGMPFDWVEELGASDELLALADEVLDGGAPQRYRHAYQEADEQAGKTLRGTLERPEVAEAIFLSNPDVYHNMLHPLLGFDGALNSRWRRVRRQLYTYVQRFCAKNETTSFFGPMAYGTVDTETVLRHDVPRTRKVFLSGWAVRALVGAIARDARLLPHLTFHRTGRAGTPELLAAIPDGGATFRAIRKASGLDGASLARAIKELISDGAVDIELGGGDYDPTPLATLRAQLSALPSSSAREEWLTQVGTIDELLGELAVAPLPRKIELVRRLEQHFTEVTGKPARRGAGAAYADRAVFFEECASPFALRLDVRDWAQRLRQALEICVAHGHETQRAAADAVRAAFGDHLELDLLDYATRAAVGSSSTSTVDAVHAPTRDVGEADRLAKLAAELPGDRYAVIDLCPAGDELVLARTHHHLLVHSWLATMHPDQDRFEADAAQWVAEQQGALVGFDFGRRNKGFYRFPGLEVAMRPLSWTDDALRPEELTVGITPDEITLTAAGQRVTAYVPLSDFVKYAPIAALSHPQVLHPKFAADGEVRIGDVVLQRARWQVPAAPLTAREPSERFLRLREIARLTGCRFVFARSEHERKPYLVDLASPLAADLVAHIARGATTLSLERMAPDPAQLWLRDADGRRYTSELRMQVIGRDTTC